MRDSSSSSRNRNAQVSWQRYSDCTVQLDVRLLNFFCSSSPSELFNPIDIFTYYTKALVRNEHGDRWNVLGRDLWPEAFLEHFWSGKYIDGSTIKDEFEAVGFKSFPDHWAEVRNEDVWENRVLDDPTVKKIILMREDELAVYLSMKRAEITGNYMTRSYPLDLKITIDPAKFQAFLNNYRDTYQRKYRSAMEQRDTFRVTYEQIVNEENFRKQILPLLWDFLGVDNSQPMKILRETKRQADPNEDFADVIENYKELEFCFRHTDVVRFTRKKVQSKKCAFSEHGGARNVVEATPSGFDFAVVEPKSWSILLPICSRVSSSSTSDIIINRKDLSSEFNANRLIDLAISSQYNPTEESDELGCWDSLANFATSLQETSDEDQLLCTECVVGIDLDDPVFRGTEAKEQIKDLLPCTVRFVDIEKPLYGRLCKIWNHLALSASNDFLLLLGDDVILRDSGWQHRVAVLFEQIKEETGLPYGAACVALRDKSFPGFPTFPVVHRWHVQRFRTLLPKQFINQGGDPYLFELYSRFGAATFDMKSSLENTVGGNRDARYKKHEINWCGQILRLQLMHLEKTPSKTSKSHLFRRGCAELSSQQQYDFASHRTSKGLHTGLRQVLVCGR